MFVICTTMLRFYYVIYLLNKLLLKAKIFKRYYDNLFAKYFDIAKTIDLIQRKFY